MSTSISAQEKAIKRLKAHKTDEESNTEFIHRVADVLDGTENTGPKPDLSDIMARLDDLEATLPKKAAQETVGMVR